MNLLLTSEVAEMFAVTPDTVRRWERLGLLPAMRTGHGVRLFARQDIERILHERGARERGPEKPNKGAS
jgi:excisionase family DNA binding protein